uniref:Uncharacterized protein n=1 Tax=Pseudo-nitzschia australis TaxID=44445 RepID=A0A7S4EKZ1_9STRA|eukprot:CAMPEP_0168236096 /NCGR_PEP_ID=MMETSP0140_2-20121125/19318_1 /TAXON_ID=44445 /ORGANISM="Pseudo-nitzschia australis, Strain 10249 10 AB" /LENGTH=319 /DNA_ID=CAMNT_0008169335 /DNA_START=280 /DNA_END=1239 /DNA_ORIENTATION=-
MVSIRLLSSISSLLLLAPAPTQGETFFWLNVDRAAGTFEVTVSEEAGVPCKESIGRLEDTIHEKFSLFAMSVDHHDHGHDHDHYDKDKDKDKDSSYNHEIYKKKNGNNGKHGNMRGPAHVLEWELLDDRIVGVLPTELTEYESSSVIVSGHLMEDAGTSTSTHTASTANDSDNRNDAGFELQHHFYSDQLLNKNTPFRIPAHETMKEKPFYVELVGCDSEIVATVHGVSNRSTFAAAEPPPVSVCVYEIGGQEIGCRDADAVTKGPQATPDTVVARIPTTLGVSTTIFAKVHVVFPGDGDGETMKYATVSDNFEPQCSY